MIRVATCVPRQFWTQDEKLGWLDQALAFNPCDLFLLPQEYFGGGSMRELCRLKGIATDDEPVTLSWIGAYVSSLCVKYNVHIGLGASVTRAGVITEDYLYLSNTGELLGSHSKMALPAQDNIALGGASHITPETDYSRATKLVEIPALGLRIGTVFCWQVFFMDMWNDLARQGCNLVVHPIKFAPRAWYKKGKNAVGENTRIGFTQNKGSEMPEDDALGWIRKLLYESQFKQLPIAVTCNTWDGGSQYLALEGWVDEVAGKTNLHSLASTTNNEIVTVTEHRPELFDALPNLNDGDYGKFKDVWEFLAAKIMMRKALKIERNTRAGKALEKLNAYKRRPEVAAANPTQQGIFEEVSEV